jgi:hypothetical protein
MSSARESIAKISGEHLRRGGDPLPGSHQAEVSR